ncbi:MAG: type II secretion system F family protein [Candidatus Parvarchaeota archaeon]|jgi:pilus assembly protein TadC|nr:type II secretion system F family protein [Candidatus Parvarchaeota archaeon]
MERQMPVIFVSEQKALYVGKRFKNLAYKIKGVAPDLQNSLVEAGINIEYIDYIAAGILTLILLLALLGGVAGLLAVVALKRGLLTSKLAAILVFMIIGVPVIYLFYFLNYPKLKASKRKRQIDEKVSFAIREIMIKVGSGVPIFNALLDVANGDYGVISREFSFTVQEIESGVPQETALEHLSLRAPSQALKRAIDILINAIKSGSDVHGTLVLINDMLIQKQQSDMKSYAGELTPMSMGYMLISVVLPSLGMSVFIILGSMAHINVVALIYIIPVILVVFQVFFMGMVSSRRPAIGV